MSEYRIAQIDFETILPVWRDRLWPNRVSPITPVNSMVYLGGYDMSIYKNTPSFFGVFFADNLVGVNSGFQTNITHYRSRGLWTDPEHTGRGVGRMLLEATEEAAKAIHEGPVLFWTIPRQSAMSFYAKCGFERVTGWFDEGMEFGPNCYARKLV